MHLVPHPSTSAAGALRIVATVACEDGGLMLEFATEGDLGRIRWPPAAAAHRSDGLWRHTCFEAFLKDVRSPAYCEFNLSPSGAWAAYHFTSYRQGQRPLELHRPPEIRVVLDADRARLCAVIALGEVEAALAGAASRPPARLQLALAAVIEDDAGALSYWALRHPAERPDFHRPEGFVVGIDAANGHGV